MKRAQKWRWCLVALVQIGVLLGAGVGVSRGCTTAVVSGKYTRSGRPILWKLRDTDSLRNRVQHYSDGRWPYVAVVNADSTAETMVWGGCNAAGFAIMNSASFNTNAGDTSRFANQEGVIMKAALMRCATLADFEQMLNGWPKPMGLNANFGVIDAQGGAAYYETDNYGYMKFDANDPRVAPEGYLIRTNYSFTGTPNVGYGFIRYTTAAAIIGRAASRGELEVELFTDRLARCLENSMTGEDFGERVSSRISGEMVNAADLLCRYGTASNIVVEGVAQGMDARQTVLWATVAFPLSTVVVPAWPTEVALLPSCAGGGPGDALPSLSDWGLQLMRRCYPIMRGSGSRYLDIAVYRNSVNGGLAPAIVSAEREVMRRARELRRGWGSGAPRQEELRAYNRWLDGYLKEVYEKLLLH